MSRIFWTNGDGSSSSSWHLKFRKLSHCFVSTFEHVQRNTKSIGWILTKFQYLLIYWNRNHAPSRVPPNSASNRLPAESDTDSKQLVGSPVNIVDAWEPNFTWLDKSSTWAFNTELLWLFSEPLLRPCLAAAVGGTRAVGGVTVLGVALATTKFPINIYVFFLFDLNNLVFGVFVRLFIVCCAIPQIQRERQKKREKR